jgi:glycosyltransferase involved in cell wall biosynthesis
MGETTTRIKSLGIPMIMDIDDYWSPGSHHPAYLLIKQSGMDKKIANNLTLADYITTTTNIFANEIKKYNKNVFVLPNAIDPKEKQYIPNPEKSDRIRIGWLGGSCLTPDTEILTDKGWKYFEDLDGSEKVATLNKTSNEIEYHKPNDYIKTPFKGDLYTVDTNEISFSVTPNHNMYISEAKNLGRKKLNFKLKPCEEIDNIDFNVKKDGINTNNDIETFILPSVEKTPFHKKDYSEKEIKMDDWLKILGFWIAEGWSDSNNKSISVCQYKNNDYLKTIYDLLIKYGFIANYVNDNIVRVCDLQLFTYFKQFGKAENKFIPRELLNNLSSRQLNILLEWYLNGDGSKEQTGDYIRKRGYTVSKQLADDLMELAFKIGCAASIKNRGKRTPKVDVKKDGSERIIIPKHDAYQIGFYEKKSKHNKLTPLIRKENIKRESYDGFVYCVNVKNNVIYVRRNGKALWVGNSHKFDLEILRGVVTQLKSDNLLDKVQFVLCGFDLRGYITFIDEKTGDKKQRPIKPEESVWYEYEKIFTGDYSTVSPEYKKFLLSFKQEEYPNVQNEPYRRVWTKPITSYASNYNLFDISLAPLQEHIFNKVKSQLKVIESGFHKKAIIAQDFGPYQIDLINMIEKGGNINENGNALLIPTEKNHKLWYQYIKKLINNPELIAKLSENLYETVKDTYSIDIVTEKRREIYNKILNR